MEIVNYKLIDFLNKDIKLIEEYSRALMYLKPAETSKEVFEMKLKHVDAIKRTVNSGNYRELIYVVSKVEGLKEKKVLDLDIIRFHSLINSIRGQIKFINKAEENGLSSSSLDVKWLAVNGSERMAKFEIYNTLDRLTGKKPHLYDYYRNMRYSEVFTILLKWKEEEDIQKEMNAIKTKKNG